MIAVNQDPGPDYPDLLERDAVLGSDLLPAVGYWRTSRCGMRALNGVDDSSLYCPPYR